MVEVCAVVMSPNIPCPFGFPITVLLSTRDDTAGTVSCKLITYLVQLLCMNTYLSFTDSGRDYNARRTVLVFERCQSKACVNVTTIDDATAELSEMFSAVLSRTSQPDNRIRLVNREATVTILDDDGKATPYIMA